MAALDVEPHRQPHALVLAVIAAGPACSRGDEWWRGRLVRPLPWPLSPPLLQSLPVRTIRRHGQTTTGAGNARTQLGFTLCSSGTPLLCWVQAGHPGLPQVAPSSMAQKPPVWPSIPPNGPVTPKTAQKRPAPPPAKSSVPGKAQCPPPERPSDPHHGPAQPTTQPSASHHNPRMAPRATSMAQCPPV